MPVLDSIVDRFLTILTEFSIKSYIDTEISSSMENQVCEYISFGGVLQLLEFSVNIFKKSYDEKLLSM